MNNISSFDWTMFGLMCAFALVCIIMGFYQLITKKILNDRELKAISEEELKKAAVIQGIAMLVMALGLVLFALNSLHIAKFLNIEGSLLILVGVLVCILNSQNLTLKK